MPSENPMLRAMLDHFPGPFLEEHSQNILARLEGCIQLPDGRLTDRVGSSTAVERFEELVERCKGSEGVRIGVCPAGQFTAALLNDHDLTGIRLELFDSRQTRLGDRPIHPLDRLPEMGLDQIWITSGSHGIEIFQYILDRGGIAPSKIQLLFFREVQPGMVRQGCAGLMAAAQGLCGKHPLLAAFGAGLGASSDRARQFVATINSSQDRSGPGRVIVFVSHNFTLNYIKHASALRSAGMHVVLLTLREKVNESFELDDIREYFDAVHSAEGNWYDFATIVHDIRPYLFHVIGFLRMTEFPLLVCAVAQRPVFLEFYDITSRCYSLEGLGKWIGPVAAQMQYEMEQRACELATGVVDKDEARAIQSVLDRYGITKRPLHFPSYAFKPFFANHAPGPRPDRPIRIVYIGGIHTEHSGIDASNPASSIYEAAKRLSAQGFIFTIFNVYDRGDDPRFGAYRALAAAEANIRYHGAVPLAQIPERIKDNDYAWFVYDNTRTDHADDFPHTAVPTKLFSYLEAGLPMIISEELRYMAGLIVEFHAGVVSKFQRLDELPELLLRADLEWLKAGALEMREAFSMDRHIQRLCAYYHGGCTDWESAQRGQIG